MIEPVGPDKQRAERRTVLRKMGAIHDGHRYEVTMRNLSRTGAGIEGMVERFGTVGPPNPAKGG